MRLFSKTLVLSHRYLGIAISLLVVVWFGSGIVMMYAGGMPTVAPETRLDAHRRDRHVSRSALAGRGRRKGRVSTPPRDGAAVASRS